MTDAITLTEDEFDERYPLLPNHLNPNASWATGDGPGCLFETYGEEFAFVRGQDPRTVWTLIDGDSGDPWLVNGLHFVNRIGYLISTVALSEDQFIAHIRQLLFNPTGEKGRGPFPHSQWGAVIKLPDLPEAFLFHHTGNSPRSPADYQIGDFIGGSAGPRRGEPAYSQMKFGPRATPAMTDPLDHPDDLGNIKGQPGRWFTVRDKP